MSSEVAFGMCLEAEKWIFQRFRCKGSPAHPTPFEEVFYTTGG
jgi:hypothetical protein